MTIENEKMNGKNLMIVNFNSLNEIVEYIKNTKSNFPPRMIEYNRFGVNSLEEALDLCNKKNIQDISNILKIKQNLDEILPYNKSKKQVIYGVYGHKVNLSRALVSNPYCMEKYDSTEKKKYIEVYYDLAVSRDDSINVIRNKGILTLSILKLLDSYNYKTNLILFSTIKLDENNYVYIKYNFNKNNYDTLYYPMCHPGFNRLILIELLRRLSNIKSNYSYPDISLNRDILNLKNNDIYISYYSTALYKSDSEKNSSSNIIIDENGMPIVFNGDTNLIHDAKIFLKSIEFDRFILNNKKLDYNENSKKFELKLK